MILEGLIIVLVLLLLAGVGGAVMLVTGAIVVYQTARDLRAQLEVAAMKDKNDHRTREIPGLNESAAFSLGAPLLGAVLDNALPSAPKVPKPPNRLKCGPCAKIRAALGL